VNELELFAGAGGGILGSQLLGHTPVCAVEFDAYARSVLLARQADGVFPPFPIWDDVRTFDGKPWRGAVDIVSGGFPCQDISVAGRGDGLEGERSGLWREMARIIGEVRPRFAFIENSPALVNRGLDRVLSDLAALGFDARWTVLGAADIGAHHQRDRIWILAYSRSNGRREREIQHVSRREAAPYASTNGEKESLADTDSAQRQRNECAERSFAKSAKFVEHGRWEIEPSFCRVVDGMAHRTHRLKAIGNGQVPQCRAAAWRLLGGH
jgi:DNA (cytosine-5)-methyltransferase 1